MIKRFAHRRPLRRALIVLVGAGLLTLGLTCRTTIVPPVHVVDPVPVFLLDHGRTATLVLPTDLNSMVRYGYGEWRWYALGKTGVWRAVEAIFWPTRGTLARQPLPGPPDARTLDQHLFVVVEHRYELHVERQAVQRLRDQLETIWHDHYHTRTGGADGETAFVRHPKAYTGWNNSNHMTARWLRELGCRTRGWTVWSRWKIAPRPTN